MTKNDQHVNSFIYANPLRKFLEQLATYSQFCNLLIFNDFKNLASTTLSSFEKFPVYAVLLNSALKVSEQLPFLLYKSLVCMFQNAQAFLV